jgi:hypothetical protein
MDGSRIPKIASEYNFTGRREVGHPRKRSQNRPKA